MKVSKPSWSSESLFLHDASSGYYVKHMGGIDARIDRFMLNEPINLKQEVEALSLTQTVSREDYDNLDRKVDDIGVVQNGLGEDFESLKQDVKALKHKLKTEYVNIGRPQAKY